MNEIGPGEGVAVFRLPLPMDGITSIHEAMERVYGTGEYMLQFNGDQIQVNAPKAGLGPVKTGRKAPLPKPSDTKTTRAKLRREKFELTLEMAEATVLTFMETTHKWFEEMGGINYVEFGLQAPDGEPTAYVYCVQRREGKTPHDVRLEAEAELRKLRAEVERLCDETDIETSEATQGWLVGNLRAVLKQERPSLEPDE